MPDRDFYFLKNIEAKCGDSYSALNEALQEIFANVRFGPPLTKKGSPSLALKEQGYAGLYLRKQDRFFALRERYGEAKITLQRAESQLERMIEKGVVNLGHEIL